MPGLKFPPATSRLLLRPWRDEDLAPFRALNADPRVAEFLGGALTPAQSDRLAAYTQQHLDKHGFTFWAVELPGIAPFIGFTGLEVSSFTAPFTPCVEIGWRLAAEYWGKGYATEAASSALSFGFSALGLAEIVSFTAVGNTRSRRVMEKIAMTRNAADDFDHPAMPPGHRLSRHVLYRAKNPGAVSRQN